MSSSNEVPPQPSSSTTDSHHHNLPIQQSQQHQHQQQHVRVGVAVLVQDPQHPSHVFCGIRKGSHGAGTLALPGGHLELYETWQECAQREVMEEMGLEIDLYDNENGSTCGHVTNDIMREERKHYVTIFMLATCRDPTAKPENREPLKCEGWQSYSWTDIQAILQKQVQGPSTTSPVRLFGPLAQLVADNPETIRRFLSG